MKNKEFRKLGGRQKRRKLQAFINQFTRGQLNESQRQLILHAVGQRQCAFKQCESIAQFMTAVNRDCCFSQPLFGTADCGGNDISAAITWNGDRNTVYIYLPAKGDASDVS